jgi:hypothetical protein
MPRPSACLGPCAAIGPGDAPSVRTPEGPAIEPPSGPAPIHWYQWLSSGLGDQGGENSIAPRPGRHLPI